MFVSSVFVYKVDFYLYIIGKSVDYLGMRSSLGKQLKRFGIHKADAKEKKDHQALALLDALEQASQVDFDSI